MPPSPARAPRLLARPSRRAPGTPQLVAPLDRPLPRTQLQTRRCCASPSTARRHWRRPPRGSLVLSLLGAAAGLHPVAGASLLPTATLGPPAPLCRPLAGAGALELGGRLWAAPMGARRPRGSALARLARRWMRACLIRRQLRLRRCQLEAYWGVGRAAARPGISWGGASHRWYAGHGCYKGAVWGRCTWRPQRGSSV